MVHPLGVFALVSSPKTDGKKAEVFLNDIFKAHRLTPHVKVIKEERAFLKRLDSLRPAGELEDDGSLEYGADVLKHLSM